MGVAERVRGAGKMDRITKERYEQCNRGEASVRRAGERVHRQGNYTAVGKVVKGRVRDTVTEYREAVRK